MNDDTLRGYCPRCGAPVVSRTVYLTGHGWCIVWMCRRAIGERATCRYRRAL